MNARIHHSRRRRLARDLARAGAALSAAMLVVGVASSSRGGDVAEAATNAGAVQVVVPPGSATAGDPLNAGGSATAFALTPPVGAACSGDSATGGYRVQSYMVPAAVDPATLTFGLTGPLPAGSGADFRQPLFTSAGSSWVNKTTAVNTGLLIGLPVLSFAWVDTGGTTFLPAGKYNLGFACTKGVSSATQLDKYWNVQIVVAADANDVPSALTWTVPAADTTTTTTSTTSTTTTVAGAATTTTLARTATTTTTTVAGATTTTAAGSTTTTTGAGFAGAAAGSNGGTNIVSTGSSPTQLLVWAVLLLVFGRMAILFGRPLRVLPPKSQ